MPLTSIIIPAFNCSKYIMETIQSILSQEGACDIEVIVINDGSTDDTGEIARGFGEPVRVIDQTNAGVCAARNRGIKEAKGEFMALVDHDDYWLPNKLVNQLIAFECHPYVDVVFSDFIRWYPDEGNGSFESPSNFKLQAEPQGIDSEYTGWIYHQMLLDSWVLTSTALVRSKVVVAAGGFDETLPFSEDWDFWLRLTRVSQFLKLREATTLYRQHPNQGSRVTRPVDYRTRLLENASKKWGLCSQDGRCVSPKQFRRQLAGYCVGFGLGHLKGEEGASRVIAAKSFLKAWSIDHRNWRALAYLAPMAIGWKPKW
jgi:glycosyltransferase involved in cell wall biosynthesis